MLWQDKSVQSEGLASFPPETRSLAGNATEPPIALKAGATEEKIAALRDPGQLGPGLSDLEHTLLTLTDVMTRDIEVPASLYEEVRAHLDDRQIIDVMVTIGAYNMVSRFLVALEMGH